MKSPELPSQSSSSLCGIHQTFAQYKFPVNEIKFCGQAGLGKGSGAGISRCGKELAILGARMQRPGGRMKYKASFDIRKMTYTSTIKQIGSCHFNQPTLKTEI